MNENEIAERIAAAKARAREPVTEATPWFYLSFVDGYEFIGACVLQAPDELSVTPRAHQLGIGSHGEVLIIRLDHQALAQIPEDLRNVRLDERTVRERLQGERIGDHLEDQQ